MGMIDMIDHEFFSVHRGLRVKVNAAIVLEKRTMVTIVSEADTIRDP
jgi:hypothetical protein